MYIFLSDMLANMCFYIFMVYGCRSIITHFVLPLSARLYALRCILMLSSDQTSDENIHKIAKYCVLYTGNYANMVFVQYHVHKA